MSKTRKEKQEAKNNVRKCTRAKMLLKKYVKTRRKVKILLLFAIIGLLVITIIVLGSSGRNAAIELLLDERFIARAYRPGGDQTPPDKPAVAAAAAVSLLQPQRDHGGVIVPEKYDEQKIKARIIQSKMDLMKQQQQRDHEAEQSVLKTSPNMSFVSLFAAFIVKNHFGCRDNGCAHFLHRPSSLVQVQEATSTACGAPERCATHNSAASQNPQHGLLSGTRPV